MFPVERFGITPLVCAIMPRTESKRKWENEGRWRVIEELISPTMCRAGRAVLDWGTGDLAKAAGVSRATVVRFDGRRETTLATIVAIRDSFTREGVVFGIDSNGLEHVAFDGNRHSSGES